MVFKEQRDRDDRSRGSLLKSATIFLAEGGGR